MPIQVQGATDVDLGKIFVVRNRHIVQQRHRRAGVSFCERIGQRAHISGGAVLFYPRNGGLLIPADGADPCYGIATPLREAVRI